MGVYGDNTTITNAGTIASTGIRGVYSEAHNTSITNTGTISSSSASGIRSKGNDTIIVNNTGGVISAGANYGIRVSGSGSEIQNHGSISAGDNYAIYAQGLNAKVENFGTIQKGSGSTAIEFTNTSGILTLNQGSSVIGDIHFSAEIASDDTSQDASGDASDDASEDASGDASDSGGSETINLAGTLNMAGGSIDGKLFISGGEVNIRTGATTLPSLDSSSENNTLKIYSGLNANPGTQQLPKHESLSRAWRRSLLANKIRFNNALTIPGGFSKTEIFTGEISQDVHFSGYGQTGILHNEAFIDGNVICSGGNCTIQILEGGQGDHLSGALISQAAENTLQIDLDEGSAYYFNLSGSTVPWTVEDLNGNPYKLIPGVCMAYDMSCSVEDNDTDSSDDATGEEGSVDDELGPRPSFMGTGLLEIRDEQLADRLSHAGRKLRGSQPGLQFELRDQDRGTSSDGHPRYDNDIYSLAYISETEKGRWMIGAQEDNIHIGAGLDVTETGLNLAYLTNIDEYTEAHALLGVDRNQSIRDFHTIDGLTQVKARFSSYTAGIGGSRSWAILDDTTFVRAELGAGCEIVGAYNEGGEFSWERESFGIGMVGVVLQTNTHAFGQVFTHRLFTSSHTVIGNDTQTYTYRGNNVEHVFISQSANNIGYSIESTVHHNLTLQAEWSYSNDELHSVGARAQFAS